MNKMDWSLWDWTKFICCNRPLDGHFDFANKPTGQLYSCLSNENSISNLSIGEQSFVNGIPSISNNLANNIYSSNSNTELFNQNNPLNSNQQPVYEYNLAEIALLDNQRAQQYIQQQKARHQLNISANQIERLKSNGNHSHQETSCTNLEIDEDKPPPLPPLPSQHLLKRSNYPCDIYRVNHSLPPPQYSDTNFIDPGLNSLYSNLSHPNQNPPQYSLAAVHQTEFDQEIDSNLNLNNRFDGQIQNFDILPDNSVLESIVNKNNSLNFSDHSHRHHLPHHRNQNSIFTSMDGLRVQIARTKKQMAAVANSVQMNSNQNQNNNNGNSFNNSSSVSSAAQSIVANLVTNQPIRAPTIQRSAEMQVSLKGWLYRLEGAGLKQWKRRWFVLGEYCLFYYKDAQEQKTLGSVLLPSYTVTTCSTNTDGITRKFSFKLEHHNTKTHYLAAECAESMHQWMTLIGLSATMQLNSSNYDQLKDGTVTAALTAANISRNRPDSQDMMNLILNRTMNINGNSLANQENNKNFNNSIEMDVCRNEQFLNANLSLNSQIQSKSLSTLDHSMMVIDDNQMNESESDCGFNNYKPNRQSKTSSDLDSLNKFNAEKYSYNSIGLPSTSSLNYSLKSSQRSNKQMLTLSQINSSQQQPVIDNSKLQNTNLPPINGTKRSHYVNAPPKPRRHQTNLQNSQNVNIDNEFENYQNGTNASLYGTNSNHFLSNSNCNLEQNSKNIPDLIDGSNNFIQQDFYSVTSIPNAIRNNQSNKENVKDQNEYIHNRRPTLIRQNASDLNIEMNNIIENQVDKTSIKQDYQTYVDSKITIKRPKSSQENQYLSSSNQIPLDYQILNNKELSSNPITAPSCRPWSDFLQQAQRSQSSTPMSTQQNRFAPVTPPLPINMITSEIVQNINSNNESSIQTSNSLYNKQYDEHAQSNCNKNFRSGSPDYMNIDFFRQNQCFAKTNSDEYVVKSENLMQKFDFNLEQQENIYQSVLSKNARLEIESLKNEVAKQELLKKQKILRVEEKEISAKENDLKTSEYQQDYIPPPLNLNARSIINRDNSKNKNFDSESKLDSDKNNEEEITENTDDTSDDFEVSPKPFSRSQFRRSFMNAVSTHKSPKMTASYHASHAYCGPLEDYQSENNNLSLNENIDTGKQDKIIENVDDKESLNNIDEEVNLTMKQRRDQLQRLLYSNSMADLNNLKEVEKKSETILKPPRSTSGDSKISIKNSSSSDSVRAIPAIIVETPEKNNEKNNQDVKENLKQNVKKFLQFDLVEPLIAQKPPRNSIKKDIILDQNCKENKKKSQFDMENQLQINENLNSNLENFSDQIAFQQELSCQNLDFSKQIPSDKDFIEDKNEKLNIKKNLEYLNTSKNDKAYNTDDNSNEKNDRSFNNSINENDQNLNEFKQEEINVHDCLSISNNKKIFQDEEEDNGYLTMESKLNSNNENDEHVNINTTEKKLEAENQKFFNDENYEKNENNFVLPRNVNFDDVFNSNRLEIDCYDQNQFSTESNLLNNKFQETKMRSDQSISNKVDDQKNDHEFFDDSYKKSFDDQFASNNGLSTIKKAPANFQSNRLNKTNDFKLTSALIEKRETKNLQSLLSNQSLESDIKPNCFKEAEQNKNQSSSKNYINKNISLNQSECSYKSQQLISSSLINCNKNIVVVSNPILSPDLMDANPAYESFDGLKYGTSCLSAENKENLNFAFETNIKDNSKVLFNSNMSFAKCEEVLIENELPKEKNTDFSKDNNSSSSSIKSSFSNSEEKSSLENIDKIDSVFSPSTNYSNSIAPYYYSDLLSEKQKLELNNKLNEGEINPPPPLLSRCNSLNNSRFLGVTSLQKAPNKKIEKSNLQENELKNSLHVFEEKFYETQVDFKNEKNNITENQDLVLNDTVSEVIVNNLFDNTLETDVNKTKDVKLKILSTSLENLNQNLIQNQNFSNSMNQLHECSNYVDCDPVYENVERFIKTNSCSSNSLNCNNKVTENFDLNSSSFVENCIETHDSSYKNDIVESHENGNIILSQENSTSNYNNTNNQISSINSANDSEIDEKVFDNLNNVTPIKFNNLSKNLINNRTTPIHLRSPTISGYATVDSEQPVLLNEDYNISKTPDNNLNSNNLNSPTSNKLSWKPNLLDSANSLNNKQNNLKSLAEVEKFNNSQNKVSLHDSTTSLSSLNSSVQSLNINNNTRVEDLNSNLSNISESSSLPNNYYRQHTSSYLQNNLNHHGNNLNNNAEKCLANKQLNLNKNINKINNLLNANNNFGNNQNYAVYENAEAERLHLLALQQQLQQQQQLLIKQQQQLQFLQRQQQLNLQNYSRKDSYEESSSSNLAAYATNQNFLANNPMPLDHHLNNLKNISIMSKNSNDKNYHNYQNIFQNEESP